MRDWMEPNCSCGKPRLPNNPFCAECDLRVLIAARQMFPDAADADFEREVNQLIDADVTRDHEEDER